MLLSLKNAARALALVGSLLGVAAVVAADVAQAGDSPSPRLDDSVVLVKQTKVKPVRVARQDPRDEALTEELGMEVPAPKPVKKSKHRRRPRVDFGSFEGY